MVKVTFSLDDATVDQLRRAAARLGMAQSHVVREAVAEYAERVDRLSERERQHLLGVLEGIGTNPPTRSARAVDSEIKAIGTGPPAGWTPLGMIVHLDTSALIDSLTGPRRSLPYLTNLVRDGHRIAMSSLVYFEWRRGPRTRAELAAQEALLPTDAVVLSTPTPPSSQPICTHASCGHEAGRSIWRSPRARFVTARASGL